MATIVNARDMLLQAASPRVIPVTLPPNVSVPPENVPGLPAYFDAAKQVVLTASSQVFQIPKVGAISPTSITLTANLKNITGTPTFTVIAGTATLNPSGNTATINPASMTTQTVQVQVSVTFNSVTYTDVMTICKVAEGADGTNGLNAVVGLLTNESVVVATNSTGTVPSYTGTGGTFKVFDGLTDKTGNAAVTYSVPSSTSVTVTIASTGVYTVSNLTADTGTATLRAVYNGVTIDKVYTIAKAKAGINGTIGADGAPGPRGNVNIAATTTGSIWSDSEAVAALSAAGFGAPQAKDIVTLYNTSTNFSQSRYYSGSAWLTLDAYLNGNLLVTGTVTANALAADSVTAGKIDVTNLAAISANLGSITAGSMNINNKFIVGTDGSVTVQNATTGQRLVITNSLLSVYDSSNVLRVRLGIW